MSSFEDYGNFVVEKLAPIKSVHDRNEYRYIRLKNGLKALIISCPLNTKETSTGPYGIEGPDFLRHGATARDKNYASDFLFTLKPKSKELVKLNENEDARIEEVIEAEEIEEYNQQMRIDEEGDGTDCDQDNGSTDCDREKAISTTYEKIEDPEILEAIEECRDCMDDEQLAEFAQSMKDLKEEILCSGNYESLNPEKLAQELIPIDLRSIGRGLDEAGKLVFLNSEEKMAKNGVLSVTFPGGSLYDPSSLVGLADLGRNCIQSDSLMPVYTGFELHLTTFTQVCKANHGIESCFNALKEAKITAKSMPKLFDSSYECSSTENEMKSLLDCESWLLNDRKHLHLLYSFAKDGHPFKNVSPNFTAGFSKNKQKRSKSEYLKDIEENLETMNQKQYCHHSASLVVQSSESLDTLESLVLKYFATGAPVIDVPQEEVPECPFDMKTFAQLYKVTYTDGNSTKPSLVISWALSPTIWRNYKGKPAEYVGMLINHKLKGGLYDTLIQQSWITDIQAGCNHTGYHRNKYCSLFQINVQLTGAGLRRVRLVARTVFAYISYLKVLGVKPEIYDALKFSREVKFNSAESECNSYRNLRVPFSHFTSPSPKISVLGESMHMISPKNMADLLSSDVLFFEYQESQISDFLTSLDMNTCNFVLSCDRFSFQNGFQQELYYGTKYFTKELPSKWKSEEYDELNGVIVNFGIPNFNEIVEKSINEHAEIDGTPENEDAVAQQIFLDLNVWKKTNHNFKEVVGYIVHYGAPILGQYSPNMAVIASLYAKMLAQSSQFVLFDTPSLHCSIEPTHLGVLVKVFGHHSQSAFLVDNIQKRFTEIVTQEPNFENVVESLQLDYRTALVRPECLAKCIYNKLTVRNYVPLTERLRSMNIREDKFMDETLRFRNSLTTGMLAIGACRTEKVLELALAGKIEENEVLRELPGGICHKAEILSLIWPRGSKIVRLENSSMEKNRCYVSQHFQLQKSTAKNQAFAQILLEITNEELFLQRNKIDQTEITASVNDFNGVMDFELTGSTANASVDEVEKLLNSFMKKIDAYIKENDQPFRDEFNTVNASLAIKRSSGRSHHAIMNEFLEYEKKVKDYSFDFEKIPFEAGLYCRLKHKEFFDWYVEHFYYDKRKLSIQIVPTPTPKDLSTKNTQRTGKRKAEDIANCGSDAFDPVYKVIIPSASDRFAGLFITDIEQFTKSLNIYAPS